MIKLMERTSISTMKRLSQQNPNQLAPHPQLQDYYPDSIRREEFLVDLFDRTATFYDSINQVASFGSGRWHRTQALYRAGLHQGMKVLDVACGTGIVTESAMKIVGDSGRVVGLDPSSGMLAQARQRGCDRLLSGRAEQLPFKDASFDFVSMGYALRHVCDLRVTFTEYNRVLKPCGKLLLLEVSKPRPGVPLGVARLYLKRIVPWVIRLNTGSRSAQTLMRYFWDTIDQCIPTETILAACKEAGFVECQVWDSCFGLIRDYTATTPP